MGDHVVPGSEDVPGREFIYVELFNGEQFADIVKSTVGCSDLVIPMPTSGGAIEHKVRARLEDGTTLLAVSYKGDLTGWRNRFLEVGKLQGRKVGIVRNCKIVFSPDEDVAFEELEFQFEEGKE